MKTLDEAIKIFENNINCYQNACFQQKVLNDTDAFFLNLLPWGKKHSGETWYQRSVAFIQKMRSAIEDETIGNTKQLLDFTLMYPLEGKAFSNCIWLSITKSAGFETVHYDYLSKNYGAFMGGLPWLERTVLQNRFS